MGHTPLSVVKMTGEKVEFNESKLRRSLERSGASDVIIQQVINEVQESLYDGISTKEIYKLAFSLLRKSSRPIAARYKLKKAILKLGPTGFPFEKFVGKILNYQGFRTSVNIIIPGHCVDHEVDVIAEKGDQYFMIECKFHSDQGRHCDVKVPLYIHSRFIDIERQWLKKEEHENKFHQGWIFTNTRFTSDAIKYGSCAELRLVSWDYPKGSSLKELIDASGLHPITCMTTLSKSEKQNLLSKEIVLSVELCQDPEVLTSIGISKQRHQKILNEANALCNMGRATNLSYE
ncbi:MAG: ATP cone domain-containing protein [Flavobacteriaceae bacterium]|nr:ATP cone domain-containing protein [Flavobacteriaceae bacterium]